MSASVVHCTCGGRKRTELREAAERCIIEIDNAVSK